MHSIGFHFFTLHGLHCIQSLCMKFTALDLDAFYHAAWITLHSMTLHGIHCIQSGCFGPCCIKSTAFNWDAFYQAVWITCNQSRCMESTALNRDDLGHAPYNPQHSIGMIWPRCMDSTAYNQDPLRHNAWNPLHSMTLHGIHCIKTGRCGT